MHFGCLLSSFAKVLEIQVILKHCFTALFNFFEKYKNASGEGGKCIEIQFEKLSKEINDRFTPLEVTLSPSFLIAPW